MKKALSILLALAMVFCLVACGEEGTDVPEVDPAAKSEGVMTYAEYVAAEEDTDVVIEGFVQSKQYYAEAYGNMTFTMQDADGAYFVYRMPATQADYDALVLGQKVKVSGVKTSWAGEVEIKEGTATYELEEGNWIAEPFDATELLDTEEMYAHQNELGVLKGMTVTKEFQYNWDGSGEEGGDIYFCVGKGDAEYSFLVESDLCGADTEVYQAVKALKVGDVVDLDCILYWYEGLQAWVTGVTVVE